MGEVIVVKPNTRVVEVRSYSGLPGSLGRSAYQIAVANGFIGTEAQWLASLQGADGIGVDGLSAYEIAVANGFVGTEAEWVISLSRPFRGARIYAPAFQLGNASLTTLTFSSTEYDTDSIYQASPSRLVVPSGITKVRVGAKSSHGNISQTGIRQTIINCSAAKEGNTVVASANAIGYNGVCTTDSGILNVTAGEYFTLSAYQNSGTSYFMSASLWMEIII